MKILKLQFFLFFFTLTSYIINIQLAKKKKVIRLLYEPPFLPPSFRGPKSIAVLGLSLPPTR